MSFGDIVTYACLMVAIWYVPRYLLRVYAPGMYVRIQNAMRDAIAAVQARDYARYEEKQARKGVNHSQNVMSRSDDRRIQTNQTDEQTDRVSEADRWLERIEVDRTKTALIELLVYSGWDASQVRSVLKGDNGVLGTEVEAARQRLGVEPPPKPTQHVTPIVGRPTNARFETDADYPYQAPAH